MGLLLGGSLLSIVEIVDLFLVYLCGRFWVKKHRPVSDVAREPDVEEGWPQKNGDAGDVTEKNGDAGDVTEPNDVK